MLHAMSRDGCTDELAATTRSLVGVRARCAVAVAVVPDLPPLRRARLVAGHVVAAAGLAVAAAALAVADKVGR